MAPEPTSAGTGARLRAAALGAIPLGLAVVLGFSVSDPARTQRFFLGTTYYFLLVTVLVWAGTYLHAARGLGRAGIVAWLKDNHAGIAVALAVTVVAALAVQPALRLLSDEAGLVGTSRNLFFKKVPTYTIASKYYYDQFWETASAIDQRPCLFPFLLSLVHVARGYAVSNVFLLNLLLLPAVVLLAYRIAKLLGGETVGLVAALMLAAQPALLITARSGAFDVLATLFALLVAHAFLVHARDPSPGRLAILWMNLCLFAEIRYESALFLPPVVALSLLFRLVKVRDLRPFALVYALTPAYLLPRLWQSILVGSVPEQVPGAVTFGAQNVVKNWVEYFRPVWSPFVLHLPHAGAVIALGVVGSVLAARWCLTRWRAGDGHAAELRFAAFVAVWMAVQSAILFTYVWGRAQHPGAARLFLTMDAFFALLGAWTVVTALARFPRYVTLLVAAATFVFYLPVASEHRLFKEMTLTREAATAWRFFESLHEKRIMIVAERPALYAIMEYGAVDFDTARQDPRMLEALSRRLFYDIFLIQKIDLTSHQPWPQHEIWPERPRDTMLEFQNDANVLIRISRLAR